MSEQARDPGSRRIDDPYRWLRDPGYPQVSDRTILAWLEAENDFYRRYFGPHEELVEGLLSELRGRVEQESESVPVRDSGYEYQWRFSAGDEYRAHYRRPIGTADWELYLDERELARGHQYFSLGGMDVSDGSVLAYATDTDGDERYVLRFRSLTGAADPPEAIDNTIGEPVWIPGTDLVLYLELTPEWRPFRVRAHRLFTATSDDPVLYEEADEGFFVDVCLSQDRRFVVVSTGDHQTSEALVVPTTDVLSRPPLLIAARRPGHEYHVDHAHAAFYILTNDRAVNFRLVTAPEDAPGEANWQEVIPGRKDAYLRSFTPFEGFLLVEERAEATDRIVVHTYEGHSHRIDFPEPHCSVSAAENPEFAVHTVRLRYESMVSPPTVYDYEIPSRRLTPRKTQVIPSGYDRSRYRSERLTATARDGRDLPISIVFPREFPTDGSGYVHLYAYGAYGAGTLPHFSTDRLSLLNRGFACAIAHVRGGDELGYEWYLDGKLANRWNTFNDFVDAAEHLIEEGYTTAGRICISGGSAGGELIGVVLNEAPHLWATAVAHVPFVDVLNTMLDDSLPLTPMEWPEWGNPLTDRDAYELIRSYSPYDNVRPQPYPPILATAGLNDPRVTYWEPAKWVARLRATKNDPNVVLLKTNMGAGHAGKSGRFEHLRETAEELAFVLLETGHEP